MFYQIKTFYLIKIYTHPETYIWWKQFISLVSLWIFFLTSPPFCYILFMNLVTILLIFGHFFLFFLSHFSFSAILFYSDHVETDHFLQHTSWFI